MDQQPNQNSQVIIVNFKSMKSKGALLSDDVLSLSVEDVAGPPALYIIKERSFFKIKKNFVKKGDK